MENELIVLNDPDTAITELQSLIAPGTHVLFLILGSNEESYNLAQAATPYGQDYRLIVHVTVQASVLPDLNDRPRAPYLGVTPPDQWASAGIAFDGTVAQFHENYSVHDIETTLLLSEVY